MRVISKLLLFWLRIITQNRIHWHIDQKQHVYGILFEDSMVLSIYLTLYFLKMKRIDIDVREIIWFRLMHIKYASFCWFVSCLSLVVWFGLVLFLYRFSMLESFKMNALNNENCFKLLCKYVENISFAWLKYVWDSGCEIVAKFFFLVIQLNEVEHQSRHTISSICSIIYKNLLFSSLPFFLLKLKQNKRPMRRLPRRIGRWTWRSAIW